MFKRSLSWYILVFTLLEFVVRTQLTTYDNSHGFISNNHDRYLAKEISSMQDELASDIRGVTINSKINSKVQIKFNPEVLDFKQRYLGVPHLEKVTLYNVDSNHTVDMTSISGNTVHFHSSFFENKKIPPLGNTTFNVVFLGREEGAVESSLFIHTTQGHFKYHVKGDSVYSPYRLRPIVGVKIPPSATFSPLIYLYNPFDAPIQVSEIYSSGGEFHLELPSGDMEGPKDLWLIPPQSTKAVIKVRFTSHLEQNYTAYVRIKLNSTEDILVVPLEVEVASNAMLYHSQGLMDFGVGSITDPPRQLNVSLCNALRKALKVLSISTSSAALFVEQENAKIPAMTNESECVQAARITVNWRRAFETKDTFGKLIVKYKNQKGRSEIPFFLTLIEGGLRFNETVTSFFVNSTRKVEKMDGREVTVKNEFQTPVKVINISVSEEAQKYFHISEFEPIVLNQNEERCIFILRVNEGVSLGALKITTHITLQTNISQFHLPLVSYDGRLDVILPHKSKDNSLDLGMISMDTKKDTYILLVNKNPVEVSLKHLSTSLPAASVEIVGCGCGNYASALLRESFINMTKCENIEPNGYAILKLSVKTGRAETQIWGDISINTGYEELSIPVHFKIASGKLEIGPDRLVFDQCFPGKICSHPLRIHSTFNDPMVIEEVLSIPPDPRINCKHSGHIMGRTTKVVGKLYLNPNVKCQNECYLGLNEDNRQAWLKTLSLGKMTTEFDLNLVNILYNRYLNQTSNGLTKWQNLTMRLDTSEVKGHMFKTRVKMSWPSLLIDQAFENKSTVAFPLTQIGNISYVNVTIRNPSSYELLVQILMDRFYPGFDVLFEGLPPVFIPSNVEPLLRRIKHGFFLEKTVENMMENFPGVHVDSLPVKLKPNEQFTFRVGFRAVDSTTNTAYVFLRNNLTILEVLQLTGKGAVPNFRFGNRKPGSSEPLIFDMTEKHLRECELSKSRKTNLPVVNLKRSFTVKNTGDVPIFINGFYVNTLPCEGYGFKVLNCEPTVLMPGDTKKIDIAFAPDFTLAKVTRMLVLDTSLNYPVNYTLVSTVPSYYLPICSSVLQRPPWEYHLYIIAVVSMVILLLFVILAPLVDADKIVQDGVTSVSKCPSHGQHTLDLRSIGAQTRQEIISKSEPPEAQQKKTQSDNVLNNNNNNNNNVARGGECVKSAAATKTENEKYTAVVPATGKSNKRKGKKLCDNMLEREQQRKQWIEAHKCKQDDHGGGSNGGKHSHSQTSSGEKEEKRSNVNGGHKKSAQPKKSLEIKHNEVPVYEEETSSNATDSSNGGNSDEIVSGGGSSGNTTSSGVSKVKAKTSPKSAMSQRVATATKQTTTTSPSPQTVDSEPQQLHILKIERVKSVPKFKPKDTHYNNNTNGNGNSSSNGKATVENKAAENLIALTNNKNSYDGISGQEKPKLTKRQRKYQSHKKLNIDKCDRSGSKSVESSTNVSPTTIRLSPSIVAPATTSSMWNETKASFSDVVARSETTSMPAPMRLTTSKPTMYVEPFKQPVELGPIGSRKLDYWQDFNAITPPHQAEEDRFVMDAHSMAMESSNAFLDVDHWQQQCLPSGNVVESMWTSSNGVNPLWECVNSPSVMVPQQQQQQLPQMSAPLESSCNGNDPLYSNYMWGMPSVWDPWTPAQQLPRTPTRTPPGFEPCRTNGSPSIEEDHLIHRRQQQQHQPPLQNGTNVNYNPFNLGTTIWSTPNQANPWNYPRSQ